MVLGGADKVLQIRKHFYELFWKAIANDSSSHLCLFAINPTHSYVNLMFFSLWNLCGLWIQFSRNAYLILICAWVCYKYLSADTPGNVWRESLFGTSSTS